PSLLACNLALPRIPFVLALAAYASARRGNNVSTVVLGILWLLFFPNAPYLLTDFIHLQESQATPHWYDALMLASFAWTGLLLGFGPLYLMQMIWQRAGGPVWSWLAVIGPLGLASFRGYLGRGLRFNSWDALVPPARTPPV